MVNSQATLVTARHAESLPEVARSPYPQQPQDVREETVRNWSSASGGLYALQALGIATCIVGASAVTGVLAMRWVMGVQTVCYFLHLFSNVVGLNDLCFKLTPAGRRVRRTSAD